MKSQPLNHHSLNINLKSKLNSTSQDQPKETHSNKLEAVANSKIKKRINKIKIINIILMAMKCYMVL